MRERVNRGVRKTSRDLGATLTVEEDLALGLRSTLTSASEEEVEGPGPTIDIDLP